MGGVPKPQMAGGPGVIFGSEPAGICDPDRNVAVDRIGTTTGVWVGVQLIFLAPVVEGAVPHGAHGARMHRGHDHGFHGVHVHQHTADTHIRGAMRTGDSARVCAVLYMDQRCGDGIAGVEFCGQSEAREGPTAGIHERYVVCACVVDSKMSRGCYSHGVVGIPAHRAAFFWARDSLADAVVLAQQRALAPLYLHPLSLCVFHLQSGHRA